MNKLSISKGWSTHMAVLIKAVQSTDGAVLEIGSGLYSTPLLHWLCAESLRKLVTYEVKPQFIEWAKEYQSRTHRITNKLPEGKFSVVFIDGEERERADLAIRYKDAEFVVIHDTEQQAYGYEKVWSHFKYRFDWKFARPWTTVVSNLKEL